MGKFRYVAMDAKGKETEGMVDADSQTRAISLIRERGLFPTSITEIGARPAARTGQGDARRGGPSAASGAGLQREIKIPSFVTAFFGRVKRKQLVVFTRQLATLQDAGLPLLRSMHVLLKQEKNPTLRTAITNIAEAVESGSTFAEALAQQPRVFDKFFVNMVRAGEAGGALEVVLNRLAEFMEKAQRVRNKVRSAMVYPIVVLLVAISILSFLLIAIIPKFRDIFQELLGGKALPALTQFVLDASSAVVHNAAYVVGGIVVLVIAFKIARRAPAMRYWLDRMKLSMPVFGTLLRKGAIANFTRTLGTLMTGGVPVLQALNIVREIAGNEVIAKAVMQVHDSVKEGESMVTPLEASRAFPPMVVSMVQVGEETGALPDMLMKVADTYDDEVDTAVDALTSIIEPILIIFLAVIVGTIVIAMFLPLVGIITTMSGGK